MSEGKKFWYIVQTYSGLENSVRDNLVQRITSMNMENLIFQVFIPEETVVEKKADGTTKEKVNKIFPGYVFIEMIDTNESWFVVRNTPGVTGFLGSSGKQARPIPVPEDEMIPILKRCGLYVPVKINLEIGERVTVTEGLYKGQIATVEAINEETQVITVAVEFFGGRELSVEVDNKNIKKF